MNNRLIAAIGKVKQSIKLFLPPIVLHFYRFCKRSLQSMIKNKDTYKQKIKFILPPVVIMFLNFFICFCVSLKDYFNHLKYTKNNDLRFSLRKYPDHGFSPLHIKNYDVKQEQLIGELAEQKDIIIFFNILYTVISGGMMSIDRIVTHLKKNKKTNEIKIVQSGLPLNYACINNPWYDWTSPLVDFNYIVEFTKPRKLLINIPEVCSSLFIEGLSTNIYSWFNSIPDLGINILNQNNEHMPSEHWLEELRTLSRGKLTITTAHERYNTKENKKKYGCEMYQLTPILPVFYRSNFWEKRNIIVVSNDDHSWKKIIINKIKKEIPEFVIITVCDMHFEKYKKLISKAKFTISFGEGFDGYFLEPYLCNSIGITVHNNTFFPELFKKVPTVYDNWNDMYIRLVNDIKIWSNNEELYKGTQSVVEFEIRKFINKDQSEKDLNAYLDRYSRIGYNNFH